MRIIFRFLPVFLLIFFGWSGMAISEIVNGIACKVGTDIITIHEFDTAYERMKRQASLLGVGIPEKMEVMNLLVDNVLIQNEAEKKGIVVMEDELDSIVENVKKQGNLTDEEFEIELARENITLADLREQYRIEILRTRLVNYLMSDSTEVLEEDEIKSFYEDQANKRLFTIPAFVKISEIYIPVSAEASYKEARDVKNRAREIYEEARSGENFEELVQIYSMAASKEENKGYLGSFTQEQLLAFMKPQDVQFIFSLDSGDVTTPIRLQDGYYIFKIREKSEKKLLSYEEARENIKSYLLKQKGEDKFETWLLKAREATKIQYVLEME